MVWEDATGQVWLGYNEPAYLAQRHGADKCPVVANLKKVLASIAQAVVGG